MNNNSLRADQSGFLSLADTAKELSCTEDEVLRRAVLDGFPLVVPYADEIIEWNGNATGRTFSVHCTLTDWIIRQLMAKGEVLVLTDVLLNHTPAPNKKFRNLADALLCFVPDSLGSGHYDLTTRTKELLIRKRDVGAMASQLQQLRSFFTPDPAPSKLETGSFSHCVTQPSPPLRPIRTVDTSRAPDLKIKRDFEKPDWQKWTVCDVVALWQAACLAADIEPPNKKTGPQVWDVEIWEETQLESFPSEFRRIWAVLNADEILRECEADPVAGRMFAPTHLPGFAKRMIEKGVHVPPEMYEIAARYPNNIETDVEPAVDRGRIEPQGGDSLTRVIWRICYDLKDERRAVTPGPVMAKLREMARKGEFPVLGEMAGGIKFEYEKGDERELNADALRSRIREWRAKTGG